MGRATANFLAPPPGALGRGQKVKYHLISVTKSISKIFIPNFVYVLTNERYKTYQMGFLFCRMGHAPGALGLPRGVNFFFQTLFCGISNRWGSRAEQNASKMFILGSKLVTFGEVKRSNIFKFRLPCKFQRFLYQTLCVFSQINRKHIEQNFYSVAGVMR